MGAGPSEAAIERHRLAVEHFVLRARRIESHSLAKDLKALLALAQGTMRFEVEPGTGKAWISHDYPPEEQVESAAARVRPLLNEDDDANLMRAVSALRYFCRADPVAKTFLKDVEKGWRMRTSRTPRESDQRLQMVSAEGVESPVLSDRELAYAYIYGDVVHHDRNHLTLTKDFGVRQRYEHAVPLVVFVMIQSGRVLSLARHAQEAGLLGLSDEVFSAQVVVGDEPFRNEVAGAYVGPVGTQPPTSMTTPPGDEWTSLLGEGTANDA